MTKHQFPHAPVLSVHVHVCVAPKTSLPYTPRQYPFGWAVGLLFSLVSFSMSFLMRLQLTALLLVASVGNACKRIKKGISCFYFSLVATGDSTGDF